MFRHFARQAAHQSFKQNALKNILKPSSSTKFTKSILDSISPLRQTSYSIKMTAIADALVARSISNVMTKLPALASESVLGPEGMLEAMDVEEEEDEEGMEALFMITLKPRFCK